MSLAMALGRRGHVLNSADDDAATKLATVDSPVLHEGEMARLRDPSQMKGLRASTLSTLFPKDQGKTLKQALADLCDQAVELVESGSADVLILSDMEGVSADQLYVPPLVAVGRCTTSSSAAGFACGPASSWRRASAVDAPPGGARGLRRWRCTLTSRSR